MGVFCGSRSGADAGYVALAREVGVLIARHDITVVYGGGRVGLMGALADAALCGGSRHRRHSADADRSRGRVTRV